MGGIGKTYMLLSLYQCKMRSRKWYHEIIIYLMSLALINLFTFYGQIGGNGPLLAFQLDVCCCLLKADQWIDIKTLLIQDIINGDITNPVSQSRSLSANQVPAPMHSDNVNHRPIKCEKVNQCKQNGYNKHTCFLCTKCQVYLCVSSECVTLCHILKIFMLTDFTDKFGFDTVNSLYSGLHWDWKRMSATERCPL